MQADTLNDVKTMVRDSTQILYVVTAGQKIITFVFNTLIVRRTNPHIFGVAAIQLELLLSTLLFLSREGVRLAVLKESPRTSAALQQIINISWIPAIILICGSIALLIYFLLEEGYFFGKAKLGVSSTLQTSVTPVVVLLYCLGALLESCSEPFLNICQLRLAAGPKASADAAAVIVRCLCTYFCIAYLQLGVLGFGIAQVLYGLTHVFVASRSAASLPKESNFTIECVGYRLFWPTYVTAVFEPSALGSVASSHSELSPTSVRSDEKKEEIDSKNMRNAGDGQMSNRRSARLAATQSTPQRLQHSVVQQLQAVDQEISVGWLNPRTLHAAVVATVSSVLKHLLTEADKIVLTATRSSQQQGTFAICANYGSLVARIIFLPLEESCRISFSRMSAQMLNAKTDDNSGKTVSPTPATVMNPDTAWDILQAMQEQLILLLRIVAVVGTVFAAFGPAYVPLLVHVLLAPQWRGVETIATLSAYCWYVIVLGLNGIGESFMYSVASAKDFSYINTGLVISTAVYGMATLLTAAGSHAALRNVQNLLGLDVQTQGAAGIVWAGVAAMSVRVLWAGYFIWQYFRKHYRRLSSLNPRKLQRPSDPGTSAAGKNTSGSEVSRHVSFLASAALIGMLARATAAWWPYIHDEHATPSMLTAALMGLTLPTAPAINTHGWKEMIWYLSQGLCVAAVYLLSVYYHATEYEVAAAVDFISRSDKASKMLQQEVERDSRKQR